MHLIDENFKPLDINKNGMDFSHLKFWEYQLLAKTYKTKDGEEHTTPPHFMLSYCEKWSMIFSPAYVLGIGKHQLILPVNFYLLIADLDAGIDWIRADEVIGRDFEVFTFASDLESDSWVLRDLKVLDRIDEVGIAYPHTKRPVVVNLGNNIACMVSIVDNYSKMNKLSFGDII